MSAQPGHTKTQLGGTLGSAAFKAISPEERLGATGKESKSNFFNYATQGLDVLENRFSKNTINIQNDPTDVEDRLRAMVVMKRVRVREFFLDFDKLRKGRVTHAQFKAILSTLGFTLTNEELASLTAKYAIDGQDMNYVDFCESIDQAFTTKGIEKNPGYKVKPLHSDDTISARKKYLQFDQNEQSSMQDVVEAYRNVILTRGLYLKPMFQDFDKINTGHCTKTQFIRVLNQLGIMVSQSVVNLLLKKYMDKGNADEVNYFEFCNDVDRPEDMFGAGRDFNHSYDYFPKAQPSAKTGTQIVNFQPDDVDDILARIRANCKEKRVRLSEFFRDFDRLRSGEVTVAQMRIALNMGNIHVS